MKSPLIWIIKQIRRRIPAIVLLTVAQVGYALFSVFFALGTRGVIDSAVAGDKQAFLNACMYQLAIICVIVICLTVMRHLRERLREC